MSDTLICSCDNIDPVAGTQRAVAAIPECRSNYRIWVNADDWPGSAMGLSWEAFASIFDRACADWNKVCGIRLVRTTDVTFAKCRVDFGGLRGSTLAWSSLANGTCAADKRQRYDIRQWNDHLLYLTILHELGHLIGLGHRSGHWVMNPSIITSLDGLVLKDIQRAVALYGGPLNDNGAPDPTTAPAPPMVRKRLVVTFGDDTLLDTELTVGRDDPAPGGGWGGQSW